MIWYYHDGTNQVGPISEEQLISLRRDAVIGADTLVWGEGMAEWTTYEAAGLSQDPGSQSSPEAAPAAGLGSHEAVCAECGLIFNKDEMIPHGRAYVCAGCKPVFLQKLREGARINTGELRYGGFWLRFGAKFVDNLLLRFLAFPIGFAVGAAMSSQTPDQALVAEVIAGLIGLAIAGLYNILLVGKYGATLGKMACKVKVVNPDGTPVSYGKATGRFFAEILSGCPTLMIGYVIAAFDDEKRALHDRICSTRVVFK